MDLDSHIGSNAACASIFSRRVTSVARAYLQALPLVIDDCGLLSVDALAPRGSRMHAKVAGSLVVDYLQPLTGKAKSESRTADVYTSRGS